MQFNNKREKEGEDEAGEEGKGEGEDEGGEGGRASTRVRGRGLEGKKTRG